MSAGPLVIEVICIFVITAYLLHRYGNVRKQRPVVTVIVFIAWYFPFMIIFVLPLDVTSTFYRQCLHDQSHEMTTLDVTNITAANITELVTSTTPMLPTAAPDNVKDIVKRDIISTSLPDLAKSLTTTAAGIVAGECRKPWSLVPDRVLPTLWRVIYWTSQVLTWLILPMMQSYSNAGDFSVAGKLKSAVIENAIYYGTYLLIFGICLIYVAARPDLNIDGEKLKVIGITASNTWGLFLLVLLLGFGLVDVPRTLWRNAKRGYQLTKTQFKIAKLSTDKTEAEETLEDVLEDTRKAAESIKYNNPQRKHVDTILEKCPEAFRKTIRNMDDYEDYNPSTETPTEKSLVRLHKRVIRALQTHNRTQCQWNMLIKNAFALEDVVNNEQNTEKTFHHSFPVTDRNSMWAAIYTPTVEWYWKVKLRPWALTIFSLCLAVMTFMVVWSECLFFIKDPVLSFFAIFINLAKENYDYLFIEISSILTIAFLSFCAYYTIFHIRILNYYYIAPHHQTDENSLIFVGMMLCRLTPPMCLNFLGLIHLDSHVIKQSMKETAYTEIMGHMDVIAIISDGFNVYFPIMIVLLCICTYFSLGSRILHFLGFQQFLGDDEMTQELTDEGRELINREKRRRERKADGDARRRIWNEKFSDRDRDRERQSQTQSYTEPSQDYRREQQFVQGRHKVARSPDENDKTNLLREIEPVDYTMDTSEFPDSFNDNRSHSGYQAHSASRFGTPRTSPKPPSGIFDDV